LAGDGSSPTFRFSSRTSTSITTTVRPTRAPACTVRSPASLPALNACTVAPTNTRKLERCTVCHSFRGSRRIANDVAWITTMRYRETTPNATGTGLHFEAMGTNRSARPKRTYGSAASAPRCTATNARVSVPR